MDRAEAKRIIRDEDLRRWFWYAKPDGEVESMAIYPDGCEWVVSTTGERAAEAGICRFSDEGQALDQFIRRLRALNWELRQPFPKGLTVGFGAPWSGQLFRTGADIDRVKP